MCCIVLCVLVISPVFRWAKRCVYVVVVVVARHHYRCARQQRSFDIAREGVCARPFQRSECMENTFYPHFHFVQLCPIHTSRMLLVYICLKSEQKAPRWAYGYLFVIWAVCKLSFCIIFIAFCFSFSPFCSTPFSFLFLYVSLTAAQNLILVARMLPRM